MKDGKTHWYWSVAENRRTDGRRVFQRQVHHLGELNDNQRAEWVRTIEAVSGEESKIKQLALFPDDPKELLIMTCETIHIQLDKNGGYSCFFRQCPQFRFGCGVFALEGGKMG